MNLKRSRLLLVPVLAILLLAGCGIRTEDIDATVDARIASAPSPQVVVVEKLVAPVGQIFTDAE
jgi:uncharacterized lipoprotein YajG